MPCLRRSAVLIAVAACGFFTAMASPGAPQARATTPPCIAVSPASALGEAFGIGNPIGDACNAVTEPILGAASDAVLGPLKEAASSIGKGIFNQVTSWVADGAVWLIGEVASLSEKTTSPDLLSKGFLRQYRLMAMIAAFLAALMLIFAVFESFGRGDPGMLFRVFLVNVPLAAIGTSVAYVVVQLLIATCDGMCVAISHSAGADSKEFFKGAIEALAKAGASGGAVAGAAAGGPTAGPTGQAAGAVAVPLFVGFIAAIVAAFAAFFVWIELLMRDAAIYVVALFMPFAIAASIWPRWMSALRRTCELLIVVIFSKFVIVAVVSLAASLLAKNDGAVEHVLAAGSMLLLACFAPFVLFKLVPFAEEASAAVFSRQSASGGAVRTVEFANSMMMVQRLSQANWAAAANGSGGGRPGAAAGAKSGRETGSSGAGEASGPQGAASGPAAAGAVPVTAAATAAESGRSVAENLSETGEARSAVKGGGGAAQGGSAQEGSQAGGATEAAEGGAARPTGTNRSEDRPSVADHADGSPSSPPSPSPSSPKPEPEDAGGGISPSKSESAPRPAAQKGDGGSERGEQ